MYAVTFDFLPEVELVEVCGNTLYFKIKHTVNASEPASVDGWVILSKKTVSREFNNTNDPQNSYDKDFEVYTVDPDSICYVDDYDNVHAIPEMPFKLTGAQLNTINEYLEEM